MPSDHVFAVIMAGGAGTRFWPLSRRERPKQLLALAEPGRTLLASTVSRVAPIIPIERVLVVTGTHLAEATREAVPTLPAENVLAEPVARNTAPCVAWAALHALRRDPDAVLAVLAADHFVRDIDGYLEVVRRAIEAAASGALVTVGIQPTRPETGYGYLELPSGNDEDDTEDDDTGSSRVVRFVEKPDLMRAAEFVSSGHFLWNSGQFFFRADAILAAIEAHLPALAESLSAVRTASSREEEDAIVARAYEDAPSISIDHGVMERAEDVRVIPGSFGWSDVGSWTTAWELAPHDAAGNAGEALFVDTRGTFVSAPPGKLVALVGVEDFVVVDTEDALLVMPRERAQDVRLVVEALRAKRPDAL